MSLLGMRGTCTTNNRYRSHPAEKVEKQSGLGAAVYLFVMKCSQEFKWCKNFNIFCLLSSSILVELGKKSVKSNGGGCLNIRRPERVKETCGQEDAIWRERL
jgi:hypothetical protein